MSNPDFLSPSRDLSNDFISSKPRLIKFATKEEQETYEKIMRNPELVRKINSLASMLVKDIDKIKGYLAHFKVGDRFKDKATGVEYEYMAPSMPTKFSMVMKIVMDMAGKPVKNEDTHIIYRVYDETSTVTAYYTISMEDFCKMFATQQWELTTTLEVMQVETIEDQFQTKGIIDPAIDLNKETISLIKP